MLRGIFYGGGLIHPGHVPGHPHHKEVAQALIKNQLHGGPGIRTGEDGGEGRLALGRGFNPPCLILVGVFGFTGHETGIALFEHFQGRVRRYSGSGPGGRGRSRQGQHQYQEKQPAPSFHDHLPQAGAGAGGGDLLPSSSAPRISSLASSIICRSF